MDKEALKQELRKELARRNFLDYCKYTIPEFKVGKFHNFMSSKIEDFLADKLLTENGDPVKILCLSMPVQHGKSVFLTQSLPSYFIW